MIYKLSADFGAGSDNPEPVLTEDLDEILDAVEDYFDADGVTITIEVTG